MYYNLKSCCRKKLACIDLRDHLTVLLVEWEMGLSVKTCSFDLNIIPLYNKKY